MTTNQQLIEQFLKHKQVNNYSRRENISPRSIKQYQLGLKYLSEDIKKPFKDATQEDFEQHLGKYAQRTRNQRIALFHNFYRWLYKLDETEPLPKCVRSLRVKHVQIDEIAYRERLVSEEEYHMLLEHAKEPVEKAVLETLWVSGARKDEIKNIQAGDVTFDGRNTKIILRVSKTKSRVYIHQGRAEYLLKWCETLAPNRDKKGMPLFTTTYRQKVVPIHDLYAWRVLERICKRAGLRHIKPHDFRHTKCTNMLRSDVQETFVKNQLGFTKDSSMLRVYDHNDETDYENYLNGKTHDVKPTYQLLEKQKTDLETRHEQELAKVKTELDQMKEEKEKNEARTKKLEQDMAEFNKRFEETIRPLWKMGVEASEKARREP